MKKVIPVLFFAFIFLSVNFPIRDPDLWWHLSAGKQILETKTIPRADTFSYTQYGRKWIDFEWLSEISAREVQKTFGFNGLKILRSVLITLVFVTLYQLLRLYGFNLIPNIFSLYIILLFVIRRASVRPELISMLLLALFLYLLERIRIKNGKYTLYFLPLIFLSWVNLHGGYVFGLGLILCYMAGSLFNKEQILLKTYSLGFILCLIAGLINPYGISVYSVPVYHWIDFGFSAKIPLIEEWQETSLNSSLLLTTTFAFYGILFLFKYIKYRKIDAVNAFVYAVFSYIGFQYVRNIAIYGILVIPFFMKEMLLMIKPGAKITALNGSKRIKFARYFIIASILIISASKRFYTELHEKDVNWNKFPVQACNFIEQIPGDARMYNSYNYGGYIDWRFSGGRKVFYDGRYIFYDLLGEFDSACASGPTPFNNFLDKYKIDYTLLRYPETGKKIEGIDRSILPFYFPKDRWALVYWDEMLVVYIRRQPEFMELIKNYEFKYFNPDDYIYILSQVQRGKMKKEVVLNELNRFNNMYPGSQLGKYFLSYFRNIGQPNR